jgi:transcriptional regulator with XRE-family HTH domain
MTDTSRPYIAYGTLIHQWRNEIKLPHRVIAKDTGISEERVRKMEKGLVKPSWAELEKLAKTFFVSVKDLLPYEDDLDRGIAISLMKDARYMDQERAGRLQYTYNGKVMSSTLPNFKPVELVLHLTEKEEVVLNNGHFFHQFTQVIGSGPVGHVWEFEGERHYQVHEEGDSWLIPGFVPHGFWSPDADNKGKILAITFGQHLASSDAKQELQLIGPDNAGSIFTDGDYYTK